MSTDSPHDPAPATYVADLVELLSQKVIGQPSALRFIVPYIEMYQAGLAPDGRPAGIFLLLGPTGTGKTRTVEALAEVLHGTDKHVLKINCGEFQSDHEVAKLIGAPPGYVGHRESPPLLTPERLAGAASTRSDLSLVLFDEIEKAAPALTTLLLGILDRATMRLGDSREVDFTKTLIFLTSNLGAREMMRELGPGMGFRQPAGARDVSDRLESIALGAVRRRFSPEFVNRIDVVVTYRPLDEDSLATIVTHHIDELQRHVSTRLGDRSFSIQVAPGAREFLQLRGTSQEYGARELRRVIHRFLTQPLAARVAREQVQPGSVVDVVLAADGESLEFVSTPASAPVVAAGGDSIRRVLVVDDNDSLTEWMRLALTARGFTVSKASTCAEGEALAHEGIDAAVLDYLLPDGDGVALGSALKARQPELAVIVISGLDLGTEELGVCERRGFAFLRKPFLGDDLVRILELMLPRSARAGA